MGSIPQNAMLLLPYGQSVPDGWTDVSSNYPGWIGHKNNSNSPSVRGDSGHYHAAASAHQHYTDHTHELQGAVNDPGPSDLSGGSVSLGSAHTHSNGNVTTYSPSIGCTASSVTYTDAVLNEPYAYEFKLVKAGANVDVPAGVAFMWGKVANPPNSLNLGASESFFLKVAASPGYLPVGCASHNDAIVAHASDHDTVNHTHDVYGNTSEETPGPYRLVDSGSTYPVLTDSTHCHYVSSSSNDGLTCFSCTNEEYHEATSWIDALDHIVVQLWQAVSVDITRKAGMLVFWDYAYGSVPDGWTAITAPSSDDYLVYIHVTGDKTINERSHDYLRQHCHNIIAHNHEMGDLSNEPTICVTGGGSNSGPVASHSACLAMMSDYEIAAVQETLAVSGTHIPLGYSLTLIEALTSHASGAVPSMAGLSMGVSL